MSNLRRQKRNKGYLLLEAVATIAVIAIGLTVILRSFASSFRASKVSQEYFTAASFLKDKMWTLEEKARREGGLEESETSENIPDSGYVMEIRVKRLSETDPLNEVRAGVTWKSGNRDEKIEVATFLRYK